MDSTIVTAMAAASGSLVGAAASIATTWITQRTQTIRANSEWKLRERRSRCIRSSSPRLRTHR